MSCNGRGGEYWPFKGAAQFAEHRHNMKHFTAQIFKEKCEKSGAPLEGWAGYYRTWILICNYRYFAPSQFNTRI